VPGTIPIVAAPILGIGIAAAAVTAGHAIDRDATVAGGSDSDGARLDVAILAGGCFWGMEHLLRDVDGVLDTDVGYARPIGGGDPAEAVRLHYDPARTSYGDILRFYFRIHDPTTPNRQGNDRGTEYRSAIFVLDDD
jgi:peptide methionine sulfoxide reductase MsrA